MKKTIKSKLRLNSQTIRSLRASGLEKVQGGQVMVDMPQLPEDTSDACTANCSFGCRGCG